MFAFVHVLSDINPEDRLSTLLTINITNHIMKLDYNNYKKEIIINLT